MNYLSVKFSDLTFPSKYAGVILPPGESSSCGKCKLTLKHMGDDEMKIISDFLDTPHQLKNLMMSSPRHNVNWKSAFASLHKRMVDKLTNSSPCNKWLWMYPPATLCRNRLETEEGVLCRYINSYQHENNVVHVFIHEESLAISGMPLKDYHIVDIHNLRISWVGSGVNMCHKLVTGKSLEKTICRRSKKYLLNGGYILNQGS